MLNSNNTGLKINSEIQILMCSLPFWPPQIPPMGIACLKSYLELYGYRVKTIDFNTDSSLWEYYNGYFDLIKKYVPVEKQGNLYGIGIDVLRNHIMAFVNREDENRYIELVEILVYETFYVKLDIDQIAELNSIVRDFLIAMEQKMISLIEEVKPDYLGLSVNSGSLAASYYLFGLVRKRYPHIKTVMGGGIFSDQLAIGSPNLEYFLEKTKSFIDRIIIGEGEILFRKMLEGEFPDNKRVLEPSDLNGELFDINNAPIPDFTDLDIKAYPYSSGYTSRSCPFQCAFCSETVLWGKYRKKTPQKAVEDFIKLYKRDGRQMYSLSDSVTNPIIDSLAEEFIKSEYAIYYDACVRAEKEVGDINNTIKWRRGGLYKAWLGVESGSQRVLDLMNKKTTIDRIKAAVTALANAGIKTATLWIVGFPGETEEDFQQTLNLLEELKDYIYDAEGTPFWYFLKGQPGSNTWQAKKSKLLYPEWAKDMLITQTWILDEGEPNRDVTYQRLNRFIQHLKKLGIPNPYSMPEIIRADKRWVKTHKNAVPPIIDFMGSDYIDECKRI